MPSGIVMQSSSTRGGDTDEQRTAALAKVFADHGHEPEKPAEVEVVEPVEPTRGDLESEEDFEARQEEFEAKQDAAAEKLEAEQEEKQEKEDEKEEEKQKRREQQLTKPSRRQRSIEKATKDLREELRKSAERIAALEGKSPRTEIEIVKAPEAPQRAKFATDAAFDEAMFDYRYQLRRAKEQNENAQQTFETQQKENLTQYQARVKAFKEDHDDWDSLLDNNTTPIHPGAQLAIIELENGPQVTYYLVTHPDDALKLARMSEIAAITELGRLSDRLKKKAAPSASSEKPKPKPKQLPEPVRPVSTSATSSTLTSREAATKHDFRAFKAAQRRGV